MTIHSDALPGTARAALAGFAALLAGIGLSRFGFTPLITPLVQQGWVAPTEAGFLGATNLAGYLAGAALLPLVARKVPLAWLIRGAVSLVCLSFLAESADLGLVWHLVWRFLAGAAGGFAMVGAVPAVMAAVPPARRGRVGGAVMTAMGVGMVGSGLLVPPVAAEGVAWAWLLYAAITAILVALCWSGLKQAPAPVGAAPPISRASVLTIIAYCASAAGFVPHTVFWVDYIARGLDFGLAAAGLYWVALGCAACVLPLLTGLLAERIGFAGAFRTALLIMTVFVLLPVFVHSPAALLASSLLGGGMGIAMPGLASGRAAELVGVARHRSLWARMTILFAVVYAGTAYALSYVFARTLSYEAVFLIGAVVMLAGTLIEWGGMRLAGISSREEPAA